MGNILNFKKPQPMPKLLGHRMSFYTDNELEITLLALNMYGFDQVRYTVKVLKTLDPLFIRDCLFKMKESDVISPLGESVINMIINNMEEIRDAN